MNGPSADARPIETRSPVWRSSIGMVCSMAIVYSSATIRPTKRELLETVLGGSVEVLGSYRFDDPAGEVGVEAFVVRRGEQLQHVVFTYRGAPLEGDEARLVSTMEHSELGPRWIYDGTTDPVALDCFRRAILGEQHPAVFEMWEEGRLVGTSESNVQLRATLGTSMEGKSVHIVLNLGQSGAARGPALVATWAGGEAVVASLGD
jgi:hypothetical protein